MDWRISDETDEGLGVAGAPSLANSKDLAAPSPGICFLPHQGGDKARQPLRIWSASIEAPTPVEATPRGPPAVPISEPAASA